VINLSPDKGQVFNEAYRVLKHGGRLMVSDIVLLGELPEAIKSSVSAYIGCVSGAIMKDDYINEIKNAGFQDVTIVEESSFSFDCMENDSTAQAIMDDCCSSEDVIQSVGNIIASIRVSGCKK
jgi:SAM-dependent methyltransferase